MTAIRVLRFVGLLLVGVGLGAGFAHLCALSNRLGLPAEAYLTVQRTYGDRILLNLIGLVALSVLGALTALTRRRPRTFAATLAAFLASAGAQAVFWAFAFPIDQATDGWTDLPLDWTRLRHQWEYAQAAIAGLELLAFGALALSILVREQPAAPRERPHRKRHGPLEFMSVH